MQPNKPLNSNPATRKKLKIIGMICLFLGLPLFLVAMIDFFMSFSSGDMPELFFLSFIGLPLVGVGIGFLQHAYIGRYSRYVAGEVSPVAVDTANYLYEGTKENLQDLATTFASSMQGKSLEVLCSHCGHSVKATDQFCDQCGKPMQHMCPSCRTSNDSDARYCRQCGKEL